MNKFLSAIRPFYLGCISLLLFGYFLSAVKGFYLYELLDTDIGVVFIVALLTITLFELAYLSKDGEEKKDKKVVEEDKVYFKKFAIEKQILEKVLSEGMNRDTDDITISSSVMEGNTVLITFVVKNLDKVNVSNTYKEEKTKLEKLIKEKFDIDNELKMKFEIEEKK